MDARFSFHLFCYVLSADKDAASETNKRMFTSSRNGNILHSCSVPAARQHANWNDCLKHGFTFSVLSSYLWLFPLFWSQRTDCTWCSRTCISVLLIAFTAMKMMSGAQAAEALFKASVTVQLVQYSSIVVPMIIIAQTHLDQFGWCTHMLLPVKTLQSNLKLQM